MTLVIGCLTEDFVIQVSDRRITGLRDGGLVDDNRNKATMFCSQMAFAYSGLAELEGLPTDIWLSTVLASVNLLSEGIETIRVNAERVFQGVILSAASKRQAFVGVGWIYPYENSPIKACQITISNARDQAGNWLPTAKDTFEIEGILKRDERAFTLCDPIGAMVSPQILSELRRNISLCIRHRSGPLPIIRLLGETIRKVAMYERTVGQSLLVIIIPKSSVQNNPILFTMPVTENGYLNINTPFFFYVPTDSKALAWQMPNFVCNRRAVYSIFEEEGIDSQEIERLRYTAENVQQRLIKIN